MARWPEFAIRSRPLWLEASRRSTPPACPTKRRLDAIAPISPDLHGVLTRIFCADDSTTEKLRLAHLVLPLVFDRSA
jgi:hypothetical protein